MSYLELLKLAAPEAIVLVAALVVLTIGLVTGRRGSGASVSVAGPGDAGDRPNALAGDTPAATPGGVGSFVAAIGLAFAAGAVLQLPSHATLFHGMLVISPLNSLFKIICLTLAFFTVFLARGEHALPNKGEYLAMILLATIGLLLLVGSEELLMIFIGLELTGLSLYVMTAFDTEHRSSAEAGLKYFLFGSLASAFTLFGLSFIYGLTGTTTLASIAQRLAAAPVEPLLAAGIVMTLIGFAFKIAAAPFHLWAPDVYQGAPVSTAAFIASGSKVASFVVLGKNRAHWLWPAAWQRRLARHGRRLDAHHRGAGGTFDSHRQSRRACAKERAPTTRLFCRRTRRLHFARTGRRRARRFFGHALLHHDLCGSRLSAPSASLHSLGGRPVAMISPILPGCAARSPLLAGCMAIFMLSLAGLPPLAGFFGKFYLFSAAFRAGDKPRPALARRSRSFWQSDLALLLPDRAQGDLR